MSFILRELPWQIAVFVDLYIDFVALSTYLILETIFIQPTPWQLDVLSMQDIRKLMFHMQNLSLINLL